MELVGIFLGREVVNLDYLNRARKFRGKKLLLKPIRPPALETLEDN